MRAWLGLVGIAVITAAAPHPAIAQPARPAITLRYQAPAECPDQLALHAGLIAQLGYDPVVPGAAREVEVVITRAADGYRATITITAPDASPAGRALPPSVRCEGVMPALELAVAVAIDAPIAPPAIPMQIEAPIDPRIAAPPRDPSPPYAAPARYAIPDGAPGPAIRIDRHSELIVLAGPHLGALVTTAAGVGIGVGYELGAWRVDAELWTAVSSRTEDASTSVATHDVTTSVRELVVRGCVRRGMFEACGGAGVGWKLERIDRTSYSDGFGFETVAIRDSITAYGLVVARVGLTLPLGERWFARPAVRAGVPLPATDIEAAGRVWAAASPIDLVASVGVGYRW